ncbi:MAG: C4-type zinc ribbon domain-containing protein [Anaerolineae bacterium]|nr:C4-type zinc ribbon domain-containing protein [Anaerolineae bacterium]
MNRAVLLYRLQQLDQEEESLRRRLREVTAALGETPALQEARQAAARAADEVHRWAVRQRDLELAVQGLKGEIAAAERTLYNGSVRNPKALDELQKKVVSLKKLLEKREEELLEAMIAREEAEEAQKQARARLAEVESAWQRNQAVLEAEKAQLEARLAEIGRARAALIPSISREDLELYRNLRRIKGGLAVAVMRFGACTACGMEVPSGRLERARETDLFFCGNCERILLPEETLP